MDELQGPAHGDLGIGECPPKKVGSVELFQRMELGDCWGEADLKECFDYLYGCKHTRTIDLGFEIVVNFQFLYSLTWVLLFNP